MKNAKELLEEFTAASFRDPRKEAEMFSEDGAFEMPYLESFGIPGRYEGREAIEGFSASCAKSIPIWTLRMSKS
jgi:hypothetical protein